MDSSHHTAKDARQVPDIDLWLLEGVRRGDESAFEALWTKYHGRIYHFVASTLFNPSVAEDITQTVFLRVWEKRAEIDLSRNFTSYIFTIAKNLVYRHTERRLLHSKYVLYAQAISTEIDCSTEERIDADLLGEHIDRLLEKLPESRRRIFVMNKIEGMSVAEIAAQLSVSQRSVETQIYRAVKFFKKYSNPCK